MRTATALLAGLVLGVCGCSATTPTAPTGTVADYACASLLTLDGREYVGHGEVARMPEVGRLLGTGRYPPCDDGNGEGIAGEDVEVHAIAGVDPARAVVVGGEQVFLAAGLDQVPDELARLFRKVRCDSAGRFRVEGDWISVPGADASEDGVAAPPYRVVIRTEGWGTAPERYRRAYLTIRVTADTSNLPGPADFEHLWHGGRMRADVHCESGRFVADALQASA